jgi:hypothetical protein
VSALVVVTHNIAQTLPAPKAARALGAVLERKPDVVSLQEWYVGRRRLLPSRAAVVWFPSFVGGCVVGISRERFVGCSSRAHRLSWPGHSDRRESGLGLEPARVAVVVRCRDRVTGQRFAFVGFHLVHGVQLAGTYRPDRPRLASRHQGEVSRLSLLVQRFQGNGHQVVAMGDSNYSGLQLPTLTSAWTGRESDEGTLGPRQVDDVFAPRAPSSVLTMSTPSDHRALFATYADPGAWG